MKISLWEKLAAGSCIILLVVMSFFMYYEGSLKPLISEPPQVLMPEPFQSEPPQVLIPEPLTIEECIVNVSALYKGQRRYGKGVIVQKNGETFVLTSQMIFIEDFEEIVVSFKGMEVEAKLIAINEEYGLAGLITIISFNNGFPISDAPNIPPDTESVAINDDNALVKVLNYLNDDWMLITGIDENYVGAPLVNSGEITGLVIGQNIANISQAIVVGNRAIREFSDQITLENN